MSPLVEYVLSKLSAANLIAGGLLLATVFGSAVFVYWRTCENKSVREFFAFLAPPEILFHPSAKADLLFWITRRLIMPFLIFPAGITFVVAVGYLVHTALGGLFGIDAPLLGPPGPVTICIF